MLAVGTIEGSRVLLVDPSTGKVRWEAKKKLSATTSHFLDTAAFQVIISDEGKFVAGVSGESEFWELWDAASGELRMTGASHNGTGMCTCEISFGIFRESVSLGCPMRAHSSGIVSVALSPTGKLLATAGEDGAVILWDIGTGHAQHVMQGHYVAIPGDVDGEDHGWPISLSFSPDGARLANGTSGIVAKTHGIHIWDTHTGALIRTLPQACDELSFAIVFSVQFSPDGRALVCVEHEPLREAPADAVVRWDLDSGEPTILLRSVTSCTVPSLDGRTIACLHDGGDAQDVMFLFDTETGTELPPRMPVETGAEGPHGHVIRAAFSVDGSKIVSNWRRFGADGTTTYATLKVRDVSTGELIHTIEPGSSVCSLAWGRDWVQDMAVAGHVAFAMGLHPRLGEGSHVLALEPGVLQMILDRAT